jgi:predicted benzoate:H+ symporter BenE
MQMSIWSDLRPSTVIFYLLSRIRISTARILCILCPILVHACLGSSVSFSPFFPYRFPLLYLCPLLYPLFTCPGFSVAASDAFGLPFFLLRLTVLGMPGL